MNNNVIGFSHLVFTVGNDYGTQKKSPFLARHFDEGKYFEFDHAEYRSAVIRNSSNAVSRLSFYGSLLNDMPAIELLHVNDPVKRVAGSYGLIVPESYKNTNESPLPVETQYFCNGKYFVSGVYDETLSAFVAYDTNLFQKDGGCWLTVNDFEAQRKFHSGISSNKILIDENEIFAVRCRVINKKLASFVIVFLRGQNNEEKIYNDDQGLSTFGWFVRNLDDAEMNGYLDWQSPSFEININANTFAAKFLYNNKGLSHELLKINK
jgi:hypothetical protein